MTSVSQTSLSAVSIASLESENSELRQQLETEKAKVQRLEHQVEELRQSAVDLRLQAEQEEEYISNTLLKKIQTLKEEKEGMMQQVEREEEYLTNTLQKKLNKLLGEKLHLEKTVLDEETLLATLQENLARAQLETERMRSEIEKMREDEAKLHQEQKQLREENTRLKQRIQRDLERSEIVASERTRQELEHDVEEERIYNQLLDAGQHAKSPLKSSSMPISIPIPISHAATIDSQHATAFRMRSGSGNDRAQQAYVRHGPSSVVSPSTSASSVSSMESRMDSRYNPKPANVDSASESGSSSTPYITYKDPKA